MKHLIFTLILLATAITSQGQSILSEVFNLNDGKEKILGGDLSLLPSYEAKGTVYRDAEGHAVDALDFLKQNGWDCIRVRLFVNPANAPKMNKGEGVCQDLEYVKAFAMKLKQMGLKFMLDFHYSDTWADPGKQFIPSDWKDHSVEALCDSIYAHTLTSLKALKAVGAEPELIQVGNEITNGMLWPVGKINHTEEDNWDILCRMIDSGSKACREVCPKAKIIIHTEKAGDWNITRRFYDELRCHRTDYDIIGLSYYPMWHRNMGVLSATLDSLELREPFRDVMIVETAAYYSHENDRWSKPDTYSEFYPISVDGQTMFTKELVAELRRHKNVTGLFWWFPEENASGSEVTKGWLNRGLFDNKTGRALPAFYEYSKWNGKRIKGLKN